MTIYLIPFVILPFAIVAQLACFRQFDRLIRHWHTRKRSHWKTEGGAVGFFFSPEGNRTNQAVFARAQHFTNWVFVQPDWVSEDEEASLLFRKFRLASNWSIGLLLAFVVALVLLAGVIALA